MVIVNPEWSTTAVASWKASGGLVLTSTESAFAGDAMICDLCRSENRVQGPKRHKAARLDVSRNGTFEADKPGNHSTTRGHSPPSGRQALQTSLRFLGNTSPD